MIKVGITGQTGFVGTQLHKALGNLAQIEIIPFEHSYFSEETRLNDFVRQCDTIVHLACLVRSEIEGEVYDVNTRLVHQLIYAMDEEGVTPNILFASSIQEGDNSEYGCSKKEGHELFQKWALKHMAGYAHMVFPNLFGPGARPNSHSFIATFCYKLTHGEIPEVMVDKTMSLKYIDNLVNELVDIIKYISETKSIIDKKFEPDIEMKVSEVLKVLQGFSMGARPKKSIECNLFDTFNSYKLYNL